MKKSLLTGLVMVACMLGATGGKNAQAVTYVYEGLPFTDVSGIFSTSDSLKINIYAPNETVMEAQTHSSGAIEGVVYSMSDGHRTLWGDNTSRVSSLNLNLDSNGIPNIWSIALGAPAGGSHMSSSFFRTSLANNLDQTFIDCAYNNPCGTGSINPGVSSSGTWSKIQGTGSIGGSTILDAIMPYSGNGNSGFIFDLVVTSQAPIYVDPLVATGYDYMVNAGANFASVILPTMGDNNFELWEKDANGNWTTKAILAGGQEYFFDSSGVSAFRITGIETSLELNPDDPMAFVTGLTFAGAGDVRMSQTPITFDTDNTQPVPEPSTMLLLGGGIAGLAFWRRRKS
jgi:hypothetical protein